MNFITIDNENKDYYLSFLTYKSNFTKVGFNTDNFDDSYERYANHINLFRDSLSKFGKKNINDIAPVEKKQYVFVSFHLGPYKLIIKYLLDKHYNVVLLVGKEFYQKENDFIKNLLKKQSHPNNRCLVLLDASKKKSLIELKSLVSSGYSVFSFIDNFNYENQNNKSKSFDDVTFFNTELLIKNGLLKISKIFKIELVLILSTLNGKNINIFSNKLPYNTRVQDIFNEFSKTLVKYHSQWEPWLYCNNWFKDILDSEELTLEILLQKRIELVRSGDKFFIYNYENYLFYEIESDDFHRVTESSRFCNY